MIATGYSYKVPSLSVTAFWSILEPVAVFGMIMLYIWDLRPSHPWSWAVIVTAVAGSHAIRRERAALHGFRIRNFLPCVREYGPALVILVSAILGASLLCGTLRHLGWRQAGLALGAYIPWAIFQQYILNGYFLRRFEGSLSPRSSAVMAAGLFAAAHIPNWVLMVLTLTGGYLAAVVYRRYKNLYFLGLAHAIVGFTVFVAMPDSLIHHLNVGPGGLAR